MQELRKIVNDGFNKFKVFQNGKEVLSIIDSLEQAKFDLTKDVAEINKKLDKLSMEASKIEGKLKEADDLAASKVIEAEQSSLAILSATEQAVKDRQVAADKKLAAIEDKIASKEAIAVSATEKAAESLAKLNDINAELEKATARFKNLVGA